MYCFHGTCTNQKGDSLPGYYVECISSDVVQSIYSDNSSTPIISVSGVANRAKVDARGNFSFYVADGTYGLKYYDKNGVFQFSEGDYSMHGLDSLTAIQASVDEAQTYAARAAAIGKNLPNKFLTRRVMSSPPTVTYSGAGAHTMGSYTTLLAVDNGVISSTFNYRRMSKPITGGGVVYDRGSTDGLTPGASTASMGSSFAFSYDAQTIELSFQNGLQKLWIKVDGEYVSLTPTTLLNDGVYGIIYIDFGSAKMREIEVILIGVGNILRFQGANIEPTASIAPVAPRGPKVFVMGDSFGIGTGATDPLKTYVPVLADTLGWDDIVNSSQGGTGILATNGGTKLTFRGRVAADVLAFSPDIIIIQGSINDGSFTSAQVATELGLLIADIEAALPYCKVIVTSMMMAAGGGFVAPSTYLAAEGLKTGAATAGVDFINLLEQDLPPQTAVSGYVTRVAAASATRLYTNIQMAKNTTLKFTNGTHFRVTLGTASGSGDWICDGDRAYSGAAINDAFTVVGNSNWSGNGKVGTPGTGTGIGNCDRMVSSDGVHPADDGHIMIGTGIAYGVAKALATI